VVGCSTLKYVLLERQASSVYNRRAKLEEEEEGRRRMEEINGDGKGREDERGFVLVVWL